MAPTTQVASVLAEPQQQQPPGQARGASTWMQLLGRMPSKGSARKPGAGAKPKRRWGSQRSKSLAEPDTVLDVSQAVQSHASGGQGGKPSRGAEGGDTAAAEKGGAQSGAKEATASAPTSSGAADTNVAGTTMEAPQPPVCPVVVHGSPGKGIFPGSGTTPQAQPKHVSARGDSSVPPVPTASPFADQASSSGPQAPSSLGGHPRGPQDKGPPLQAVLAWNRVDLCIVARALQMAG